MPAQASWVRAGPGRGLGEKAVIGTEGLKTEAKLCHLYAQKSLDQSFLARRAAHRNTHEWTKSREDPGVLAVCETGEAMGGRASLLWSVETQMMQNSGQHQDKVRVTVGDVTEAGRGEGCGG